MSDDTEQHVIDSIRTLSTETGELRADLRAYNAAQEARAQAQARAQRRRDRIGIAAIVVGLFLIGGLAQAAFDARATSERFQQVTAQNQADIAASQRKWCPVLGALTSGPSSGTARGEWLRDVFSHLFVDYGCTPADIQSIPDVPTPSPSPTQTP